MKGLFGSLTTALQKPKVDPAITADLFTHPIFLRTDDDILSPMIDSLRGVIQSEIRMDGIKWVLNSHYQRFDEALGRVFPGGKPAKELLDQFTKINESNIRLCWKVMAPGEIYFRCLDCEVVDTLRNISGQCQECFDESEHEGHRIQKCKPLPNMSYTCDCGRIDMMRAEGFCPRHRPVETTTEEMLTDFPKEVRQQFGERFKKALYGVICMFEIQDKSIGSDLKSEIGKLAHSYTARLLENYTTLVEKICKSFSLVLETVFQSKFEENSLVWHDCNDLKDDNHAKNSGAGQCKPCDCTVIGCILRFSKFFDQHSQERIQDIITETLKEKSAKQLLRRETYRNVSFLLEDPTKEDGDLKKSSSLLWGQFFCKVPLEDELQHLVNFMEFLKRYVNRFSQKPFGIYPGALLASTLMENLIREFSESDVKALQETRLINDIFEMFSGFQTKVLLEGEIFVEMDVHQLQLPIRNESLQIERQFCLALDHAMRRFSDFQPEVKDSIFKDIVKTWYAHFEKVRPILESQRQSRNQISFLCGLEKTLCLMIVHYLQGEITKDGLDKFFETFLPDVDPSALTSHVIVGPLRSFGLSRFVYINDAFEANRCYYKTDNCLYDVGIATIQIIALLINPQEFFSIFIKSFFFYSQELIEFCLSFGMAQPIQNYASHKQMIYHLSDFLEFFVYLMNDELCLMNLDLREQLGRDRPGLPPERVIRKVFANLLIDGKFTQISGIKNFSNNFIYPNPGVRVNNVISKIIMIDDHTGDVKLKKEYQAELDPYLFYKHYQYKERRQAMLTTEMNTQNLDLVSGVFYTDLPSRLKGLQHSIFQSQLPDLVSHLIISPSQDTSRLLKPAFKLVLFNLQVRNEAVESSNTNAENLKNKVEANFLTQDFANSLSQILTGGEFIECELCIKKVQELITQLQMNQKSPLEQEEALVKENKENASEEKKKQAKEKMEKLKEEFAKKQALFAQKNEDAFNKDNIESPEGKSKAIENSPDKKDLVCQFCLDKIDETSNIEYGVPIYIEFTNNLYDTEKEVVFKEEDYTDLSKARWWPVISSCGHYYHHKCFDEHCHNSKGPQNQLSQYFVNDVETQCALCKTLCNSFLDVNDRQVSQNSKSLGETFFLRMEHLLDDRKAKLLMHRKLSEKEKLSNIPKVELSRRTYGYFTESFHVHEKSSVLSESFELYVNFFKTLRDVTQKEDKKISAENRSMLDSLRKKRLEQPGARLCQEAIVTGIFFDLLVEQCGLSTESSQEDFMSELLRIIKEYLAVNLVVIARIENPNVDIAFSDIAALYKENQGLRARTVSELVFQMHKILLALYLNKCVFYPSEYPERSEFCKVLLGSESDSEKLNLLLKHCGIPISFEQLVEESLPMLDTLSQGNKDELGFALNLQGVVTQINKQKLAPQYVQIPKTYMEFNQKYVRQRCNLCKTHNKYFYHCMCLICGEQLCAESCPNQDEKPKNLSAHAGKYHMGLSLFLAMDRFVLIAVKWPSFLGFSLDSSYMNELGECLFYIFYAREFDGIGVSKHLDYKSFVLDKKFSEKVKNVVRNHGIGKVMFEKALQPVGSLQGHDLSI